MTECLALKKKLHCGCTSFAARAVWARRRGVLGLLFCATPRAFFAAYQLEIRVQGLVYPTRRAGRPYGARRH